MAIESLRDIQKGAASAFAASLPIGGVVGQVLTKNSSNNFDASWQNSGGGGGSGLTYSQVLSAVSLRL